MVERPTQITRVEARSLPWTASRTMSSQCPARSCSAPSVLVLLAGCVDAEHYSPTPDAIVISGLRRTIAQPFVFRPVTVPRLRPAGSDGSVDLPEPQNAGLRVDTMASKCLQDKDLDRVGFEQALILLQERRFRRI